MFKIKNESNSRLFFYCSLGLTVSMEFRGTRREEGYGGSQPPRISEIYKFLEGFPERKEYYLC